MFIRLFFCLAGVYTSIFCLFSFCYPYSLYISLDYLVFDGGYANYAVPTINPTVGVPTDSFALSLSTYPTYGITVTASSDPPGAITFSPSSSFSFTSTPAIFPFFYTSNVVGDITLVWSISGPDSATYAPVNTSIISYISMLNKNTITQKKKISPEL